MGYEEYEQFPVPQVVAGFEAEDILLGLLMLVEQIRERERTGSTTRTRGQSQGKET